jgi:hypothetical protein
MKIVALWDRALSCKMNRSPYSYMSGPTGRILFRSLSIAPLHYTALIVSHFGTNSLCITPCQSQKTTNTIFTPKLQESQFFRPWRGFPDLCSGLTFSGRTVGKTARLIASYNLLKEVSITVCCGNQMSASCNSPVFLLWSQ